jgi:hypothetical protein
MVIHQSPTIFDIAVETVMMIAMSESKIGPSL